jgi:type II secretory pathway pseudopilin PulG
MPWLLLRKFWPVIVGTLALLALYAWHANVIKKARADERQKVTLAYQQALQDVITKREERLIDVRAQYEAKIDSLSQSVAIELRGAPIRMCSYTVSVPTFEGASGLIGSPAGEPTGAASRDLRAEIVAAGERAEKMRQQLLAIKALQAD